MIAEQNKKELTLNVNPFNELSELSGKDAWIRMVLNLLFMRKGSYPSCPNMGVDIISTYEFEFADNAIRKIQEDAMEQISTYLQGIPLTDITINVKRLPKLNKPVLIISLTFLHNEKRDISVVAVTERNNIIDFAIAV